MLTITLGGFPLNQPAVALLQAAAHHGWANQGWCRLSASGVSPARPSKTPQRTCIPWHLDLEKTWLWAYGPILTNQ